MRNQKLFALALMVGMALTAGFAQAKPMKYGQRPSQCRNWDCQGKIICSCCFFNGCWICDYGGGGTPDLDKCHWDDAATITNQPSSRRSTVRPGDPLAPGN